MNSRKGFSTLQHKCHGFTLGEMLLAMLLSGIIFMGAAQFFPQLFQQSRRWQQQQLLSQEIHQLLLILEKNLRRAGYCQRSPCAGTPVSISQEGRCLIVRLQERRTFSVTQTPGLHNESYGFRWRAGQIETQRSVKDCDGSGWERLTDPATLQVEELRFLVQPPRVGIDIRASAGPTVNISRQHWLLAENL